LKLYYGYDTFSKDVHLLLDQLKNNHYDAIIAISRGGLTLGHCLAEALNIRNVQSMRTELYDGMQKREKISVFGRCELRGCQKVLVVDDIADSGETLDVMMRHLQGQFTGITFESATLFYKKTSVYEPTFWVQEASQWIEFFWEVDFSLE